MGGLQSIQNYYPSCLTSTIQGVSSTLSLTCISFHLKHQNTLTVLRESFVDLGVLEFQLGQKLKSLHFQLFHLDLLTSAICSFLVASCCCTRMASPLVTPQLSGQDMAGQKGRPLAGFMFSQ